MALHQYIGARYVPKFYLNSDNTSDWRGGVIYEPLTIVTYNGNSYTSRKAVPANIGNPSENPEYWVSTGMFNEQLNDVISRVNTLSEDVDAVEKILDSYINVKDYGAAGDGETNDTAAITAAINAAVTAGNHCVYFPDGIYLTDGHRLANYVCLYGPRATLKASSSCINVLTVEVPWLGNNRQAHGDNAFIEINIDGSSTAEIGINAIQANGYVVRYSSIRFCKLYGIKTTSVSPEFVLDNLYIRGTGAGSTGIEIGEDSRIYNVCMMDCYTALHILRGGVIVNNFSAWMYSDINGSVGILHEATSGVTEITNIMIDTYTYAVKKNIGSVLNISNMIYLISTEFYLEDYTPPVIFFDSGSDSYKYSKITGVFGDGVSYNRSSLSNKEHFFADIKDFYINNCNNPGSINRYPITFSAATVNNSFYEWDIFNKKLTVHLEATFPRLTSGLGFDIPKLARPRYGIVSIGTTLYDHVDTALLYLGDSSRAALNLKNGASIESACSITCDITVSGF